MKIRKVLLLLVFMSNGASIVSAEIRNIAVYSNHSYNTDRINEIYENTFIYKANRNTSLLGRIYYDKRKSWDNKIFFIGPVINFSKYTYCEFIYGHGEDADGNNSDYYLIEATRELPEILYGAGYKHGSLKGFYFDIISPFIKYWIMDDLSIRSRFYLVRDSNKDFEYALLGELEYKILKNMILNAGGTTGDRLFDAEYGNEGNKNFYSVFSGIKYLFSEKTYIKYIYEMLIQENNIEVRKNTFVLDFKF